MRIIKISLLISLLSPFCFANENVEYVYPADGYKYVNISKNDTNRIFCRESNIGQIATSKNKEIGIKSDGKNAYVKLKEIVIQNNGQVISKKVNDFNREIYVPCGNYTYSLFLVPKDITAQTIVLDTKGRDKKDYKKAKKYEKINQFDAVTNDLLVKAYNEITPSGYSNVFIGKTVKEYEELSLIHLKKYVGNNYVVHEYIIQANINLDELDEKMFIPDLKNPLKIALEKFSVKKNDSIRMFVVSNNNAPSYTYNTKMINFIKDKETKKNKKPKKKQSIKKKKEDSVVKAKDIKSNYKINPNIYNTKNANSKLINDRLQGYMKKIYGDPATNKKEAKK